MNMTADAGDQIRAAGSALPESLGPSCDGQSGHTPAVIEIPGGVEAPACARRWIRSCLAGQSIGTESDVVLILSELVTNSVVHAHADSAQLLRITVSRLKDHLRVAVSDNGSETLPHVREAGDGARGGAGLRIVEFLSLGWGVNRNDTGTTEVWCDIALSR
jgi:anti-sigma regulatory factor (Ser/Thr protein kinase)